jgi:hypothetical protein
MRIVLLWHRIGGAVERLGPETVARNLQKMFSPLFSVPPKATIRQNSAKRMVFLELPVRGWKAPFFQQDGLQKDPVSPAWDAVTAGSKWDEPNDPRCLVGVGEPR